MEEDQLTKLAYPYTFWFSYFKENRMKQVDDYESNIKEIGDFDTAEEFWGYYQHIRRPDFLPKGCEFFLFKQGVRPLWEDSSNKGGGRFVLHIKKMFANKTWEDILIAFIIAGADFDKLNGIVINIRSWEVLLSIWMKPLRDEEERNYYRGWIRSSLGMTDNIQIEYKQHPNPDDLKQKAALQQEERRLIQARENAKAKRLQAQKQPLDKEEQEEEEPAESSEGEEGSEEEKATQVDSDNGESEEGK